MPVYFDASSLAKRYVREAGTDAVNHIFARVSADRLAVLAVGIGEVLSVLVRKKNRGDLTPRAFQSASATFRAEVVADPLVRKVVPTLADVEGSLPLIDRYALNATDALILRTALDLHATAGPVVLVSSDLRLLAGAAAERLPVYDPERQPPAAFDAVWP